MKAEDYSVTYTRHSWRWWSVEIRFDDEWWFTHGTHRQCVNYFREKVK